MDRHLPSQTAAFNMLPIELNKEIAGHLETDQDICGFRLICRKTNDAVDGDWGSFWRAKFREKYAFQEGRSNKGLKKQYQQRAKYLRRGVIANFIDPLGLNERRVVHIIRELIVESYTGVHDYDDCGRPRCPNQEQIIKFMLNSKAFLAVKPSPSSNPKPSQFVAAKKALDAVKIMCGQFLFELDAFKYDIYAFDDSQKVVYETKSRMPLFDEYHTINMDWVLHCLNFFRHHMMREDSMTLYNTMQSMPIEDRPSAWRDPLKFGAYPLSKYWKGTYAYLEGKELSKIRELSMGGKKGRNTDDCWFEDKNVEEGGHIQELVLNFVEGDTLEWPQSFEDRLQSRRPPLSMPPNTRANSRNPKGEEQGRVSIRLTGRGMDQDDKFYASGWLNPLDPQQGIPGWQRVTLMKHFHEDYDESQDNDLWAYEGVVLPGGRLMFGRWWYASPEPEHPAFGDYSGPFILWAVDSAPNLDSDSETGGDEGNEGDESDE